MDTRSKIIVCIFFLWAYPLFAQGTWVPFVSSINGNSVRAASFLNEQFGFVETPVGWYRTSDGGATWNETGLPQILPSHLNFYYYTPDTIFINGRYESDDSGYYWFQVPNPPNSNSIYIKEGIVYDGFGRISTDRMKSWKTIPNFSSGATVVGNLDNGIAMWDEATLYSQNNGSTWFDGGVGVESDYGYAIPFTNTYIRAGGDGVDAIQRSLDGGASWQTMYGIVNQRYFSDGIAGVGCIIYVQTTGAVPNNAGGVMQSTDGGATWTNIGGPSTRDDYPLCGATTRGSVCFAMGPPGSAVWKYSDPSLALPPSADTRITKLFPDTVFVNECDSVKLRLLIAFDACDFIRMHSVGIDNLSPSLWRASFRQNNPIGTGRPDSASVTIHPTLAGTYKLLVHLTLSASDWSPMDMIFPVTLIVSSVKPRLDISPKNVDFGRKAICVAAGKDTIRLTNPSCENIFIQDIRFEIDSAWLSDFTLTKKSPSTISVSSQTQLITLAYHPIKTGAKNGKIIIVTNIGNDTIPVSADTYPDSSRLVIEHSGAVSFPPQVLCNSGGYDTLKLSNPGCTPLAIESIFFAGDSLSQNDFSLNISGSQILSGSTPSRIIFIAFHPLSSGPKNGYIIIQTNMGTDTVLVSALILPDAKTFITHSDSLSAPLCDSMDGMIFLRNTSCRQMRFEDLVVSSPYKLLPVSFPVILDPGDSAEVPVRFTPLMRGENSIHVASKLFFYEPLGAEEIDTTILLSGFGMPGPFAYSISPKTITFDTLHLCDSSNARLTIYSTGCDSVPISGIALSGDSDFHYSVPSTQYSSLPAGDSLVLNIMLRPHSTGNKSGIVTISLGNGKSEPVDLGATVIRPLRILSSKEQGTIDFGARLLCETGDTLITLYNQGCDTIRVSSLGVHGSGFGIGNSFPIIIPPGESRAATIKTFPDTTGGKLSTSDTLTISSNADNAIAPLLLIEGYIRPYPVHLWLDGSADPAPSPSVWTMRVKGMPQELRDVHSIDFGLDYNMDMLEYISAKSTASSSDGGKHFHIASQGITSDSSVAEIAFNVYLSADTSTVLSLKDIIFNASDPKFTDCVATPLAAGMMFNYFNTCGDKSIRDALRGEPLEFSIVPNPAQDEITIVAQMSRLPATIQIFDAIGKKRTYLSDETNKTSVDVRDYPPGIYFVRIGNISVSFLKMN